MKRTRNKIASTYETVHKKLSVVRGKARNFACEHCGEPAAQWALSANASEILIQQGTNEHGRLFSRQMEDYLSLCRKCHIRQDMESGLSRAPYGTHKAKSYCTVRENNEICGLESHGRGMCSTHYRRWYREHGSDA